MSHFYGTICGRAKHPATRCGDKSGISGHIRGWTLGGKVTMAHFNSMDICILHLTGGSERPKTELHLGNWAMRDGLFVPADPTADKLADVLADSHIHLIGAMPLEEGR